MRQFEVYENSTPSRSFAPYFVVLQSHHLRNLDTVVVAPLVSDGGSGLPELEVSVEIDGQRLLVAIQELASIDKATLRKKRGDFLNYESEIRWALERVFTGF